jgi:hypothetical protein
MFSIFRNPSEQTKKQLFALLAEMEKNLEYFYVMDQRQFITHGFLIEVWPQVKDMEFVKKHASIIKYGQAMEDFNHALKAQKEYEAWYTSDIKNKTPENAKKLHAMKHELDARVKTLEAIIIPAGQDLEREMLQLGLLKS